MPKAGVKKKGAGRAKRDGAAPRSLRDEQKRFTRKRLLDAAVETFGELGYAPTTIEDIASAAGASRATFYLHFRSKAEIVEELLDRQRDEIEECYSAMAGLTDPTWQDLRQWLTDAIEFWEARRAVRRIIHQATGVEPQIAKRYAENVTMTIDVIAEHLHRDHVADKDHASALALLLVCQLDRVTVFWDSYSKKLDRDVVFDSLTSQWWDVFDASSVDGRAIPADAASRR